MHKLWLFGSHVLLLFLLEHTAGHGYRRRELRLRQLQTKRSLHQGLGWLHLRVAAALRVLLHSGALPGEEVQGGDGLLPLAARGCGRVQGILKTIAGRL